MNGLLPVTDVEIDDTAPKNLRWLQPSLTESNVDLLTDCENPVLFALAPNARRRGQGDTTVERFALIEDAEALETKAERYDAIEAALLNGDIFSALQQLNGKNSPESFELLVDNFLPTLHALSFDMYCRAIRPVLEDILLTTHGYAMRVGDQSLERAAYRLHKHLLATEEDRQYTLTPRTVEPRDRKVH